MWARFAVCMNQTRHRQRLIPWSKIVGLGGGTLLFALCVLAPGWAYFKSLEQYRITAQPVASTPVTDPRLASLRAKFEDAAMPFPPERLSASFILGDDRVDLYSHNKNSQTIHIGNVPLPNPDSLSVPAGFFQNNGTGQLVSAVRQKGTADTEVIATQSLGKELALLARIMPAQALTMIAVTTDGRLNHRDDAAESGLPAELQASLARLPVPTDRWKAVLAER